MKKYLTLTNIKYVLFMFGVILFLFNMQITSQGLKVIGFSSSGIFISFNFIDSLLAFTPYLFIRIWEAFYK